MIEAPAWAWAIVRRVADLLASEGWDVTDTARIPMDVRMAAVRKVMA